MAGQSSDDDVSPQSTPVRRQRAPTITIDTSAVSSSQEESGQNALADETNPPENATRHENADIDPSASTGNSTQAAHLGSQLDNFSLERGDGNNNDNSRPTSPHNVSPPAMKPAESSSHNFLSVPGTRSRGNSLDSDVGNSSASVGSETCVASSGSAGEQLSGDSSKSDKDIRHDPDALKPDPNSEEEFEVENNKFGFSPGQLNKLINPKSLSAFYALGGLRGIEKGLRSDRSAGLSRDESTVDGKVTFEDATGNIEEESIQKSPTRVATTKSTTAESSTNTSNSFADRKRVFSDNRLPARKTKSIWELAWIAYNDNVLILLSVAAVISLALGIYQSVTATGDEARVQWVEGVAIMVAILVVVAVGAVNDWKKEQQFVKLNKKKEDRFVKLIRSGKSTEVSVYDIFAGDVMHLEPGDMVPVDGVFIEGHNVTCDESSATGESDLLRKTPSAEVYRAIENQEPLGKLDPFILSGSKVAEGIGTFMVTATGVNSSYGKTLLSLQDEGQTTPLQTKLNILAEYIAKLGLASGLLLFVVLFIKFLVHLGSIDGAAEKGQAFLQIFIMAVTVIVVAVPEGLPLAVTLALAFATTRMLKDNNLVRLLRACETMGNATTICSDKTGTLTQNKMTVVAGTFGTSFRFGDSNVSGAADDQSGDHLQIDGQSQELGTTSASNDISPAECIATLSAPIKALVKESICLNSTAFESEENGSVTFVGSKTETALLSFAHDHLALGSVNEERSNAEVVQIVPFDSGRKCMATVIKTPEGKFRMFVKGASEILISKCTKMISDPASDLADVSLTSKHRSSLGNIVELYASNSLRTIGLVYRDFEQWPPRGAATQESDRRLAQFDPLFDDMVFLCVVGIQDPLRPGVKESVLQCQKAGVFVRMVTGDNLTTAKAIAESCGIFTPGGIAIEGPRFRKLSTYQMNQIIPRLQVLARSSPEDKRILVSQLRKLGETVAVTGDGTNDAPALKGADVGFSMGIAGTEVAKEASAIILMDDNFNSIVKAICWGRTVNDAVKKFLQFQVTVNITAVILTFVSAVASNDEESVLTAVQLLWVNLIMDTFAALALATDPPPPTILDRRPEPRNTPLITLTMWKMIIGQAIYQLVVTFILNFAGKRILNYGDSDHETAVFKTLIFNSFVWMQIFNQYNSRRIDSRLNIFEGMFKNYWFIGIQFIIVGGQILIVFVGGAAFSVKPLDGREWGISLVLGLLSLPIGVIIRLVPDEFIRKLIPHLWHKKSSSPALVVSDEDQRYVWNPALQEIHDQLSFLKTVRGGRLNNVKYKLQHPQTLLPRSRSGSRSRESAPQTPQGETASTSYFNNGNSHSDSNHPPTPDSRSRHRGRSRSNSAFGPAAAMAGIIAGSIGGWSPVNRNNANDNDKFTGPGRHSGLHGQDGIEIHPGTKEDDPIINTRPQSSKIPPSQNPELTPEFAHLPPPLSSSRSRSPDRRRRSGSAHSKLSSSTAAHQQPHPPPPPPSSS